MRDLALAPDKPFCKKGLSPKKFDKIIFAIFGRTASSPAAKNSSVGGYRPPAFNFNLQPKMLYRHLQFRIDMQG